MAKRSSTVQERKPGVSDKILQAVKEVFIRIAHELIRLLWWGSYDLL